MEQLFGQQVFEVGDETYCWEDVVAFGILTGRMAALEHRIRQGLASEAFAASQPEDTDTDDKVDTAAAEFRYARDLVTAEETEDWLAARNLSIDEWMGLIRRDVLRERYASRLDQLVRDFPPTPAAVLEAIRVEWLCADSSSALTEGLAQWAAVTAAMEELEPEKPEEPAPEELDFGDEEKAAEAIDLAPYRSRLGSLGEEALEGVVGRLLRLRDGHARYCVNAASPAAIRKELDMHRLDWVRMDARALFFENEAGSREGALCIREDGMTFDQLAADAVTPVFDVRFLLTEIAEEVRSILLAALPREVVGPIWFDERWALLLVLDKILPNEHDQSLRHMAVESAVARAVATQVNLRVTWRLT